MRIQFALCAQTATIDRTTNRLTIVNVMDVLPVSSFPLLIPNMCFICSIEGAKDAEGTVKGFFQILSNDVLVGATDVPINFTENALARVVLNLQGIPVRSPGNLTCRLTLASGLLAETSIQVLSVNQKEAMQTITPATPGTPPFVS